MTLSREAKLVAGISLLTVPTVQYGGLTLLGVLTQGTAGTVPGDLALNETQWSLWRAGHAHAGVWLILSLVLQVLLDSARLGPSMKWSARIAAPLAAVAVSGGLYLLLFGSRLIRTSEQRPPVEVEPATHAAEDFHEPGLAGGLVGRAEPFAKQVALKPIPALLSATVFVGVIALAALNVAPIAACAFAGAVLLILLRVITAEEA